MGGQFDIILVGGGLQSALIALAFRRWQPGARVALFEAGTQLGGNHLWSFHAGDLSSEMRELVAPMVGRTWQSYRVAFPGYERVLPHAYASVASEDMHRHVSGVFQAQGWKLGLGMIVDVVEPQAIVTRDGTQFRADLVVDARGPERLPTKAGTAYQKFLGLELELEADVETEVPTVMDARVAQIDGYRFVYVLPFGPRRVLLEDTYFSMQPQLDVPALTERILRYALDHGMRVKNILREERGVIPLPFRVPAPTTTLPLRAGYGGGWFHPTTGYSFPVAARLAQCLASRPLTDFPSADFRELSRVQARQLRFSTFLNRLLFHGFSPEDRWHVLERFYRLPADTIARFYAHETTALDRARVICGRPPRGISPLSLISGGAS